MKKKLLCLILGLLLTVPFFAACKDDTDVPPSGGSESNGTEDETLPVPVADLDQDFTILVGHDLINGYGLTTFTTEESGTRLNDAIISRNQLLEKRLNITLKSETVDCYEAEALIERLCTAGSFVYDSFAIHMNLGVPLSVKGLFLSSAELEPTLDLSQSWWDETALNCLRLNDRIYPLIGKGVLNYYESALFMAYNKDYAADLSFPNFATMALEGDWTWETFYQYSIDAYQDSNSDSTKSEGDMFGYTGATGLAINALYTSGETVVVYDENNYPSFTGFNQRSVNIFDYIVQNFYDQDAIFLAPRDKELLADKGANNSWHNVFGSGHSLFYSDCIGSLDKFRDATFEFTVLPYPKNETNDDYLTVIACYAEAMFVPKCTPNAQATAIVLENLMYESEQTVFPEYLEQVVQLQRVRNVDSYSVMTEIIWATDRFISMLDIYKWGDLSSQITEYALNKQSITTLGQSVARTMAALIEASIGPKP